MCSRATQLTYVLKNICSMASYYRKFGAKTYDPGPLTCSIEWLWQLGQGPAPIRTIINADEPGGLGLASPPPLRPSSTVSGDGSRSRHGVQEANWPKKMQQCIENLRICLHNWRKNIHSNPVRCQHTEFD